MSKLFLAALLTLVGTFLAAKAQAQYIFIDDGASRLCLSLALPSDKSQCLSQIRAHAFDPIAVGVCSTMLFDSEKSHCLKTIADRKFANEYEVANCRNRLIDSDKRTCLKNASSVVFNGYNTQVPGTIQAIDQQVFAAIQALQSRDEARASAILKNLHVQLELMQRR